MITVRQATIDDDPVVTFMARQFKESLRCYDDIVFSEPSATRWLSMVRSQGSSFIAEDDGVPIGIAASMYAPQLFNDDFTVGAELWWFIAPAYRRSGAGALLLQALEAHAKARGCIRFSMIAIVDGTEDRVARIYEKAGYVASEQTFSKVP